MILIQCYYLVSNASLKIAFANLWGNNKKLQLKSINNTLCFQKPIHKNLIKIIL